MGSDISKSQQFRNMFPISDYRILPSDPYFPDLTIIQRINDSAVFAACSVGRDTQNYHKINSKNIIKRVQRIQADNKVFELYEWATANVQGLVEYITLMDKNRKISKTEYKSIVQGTIKGYEALVKQYGGVQCLQINMQNLRIFNQVLLKVNELNTKQVVNSICIKIIPNNFNCFAQGHLVNDCNNNSNKMKWNNVDQCIHRGGILTDKQLLGQYLLQLANYATKNQQKIRSQSLKNVKEKFGWRLFKLIQALLGNQDWKMIIKILETQEKPQQQRKQQSTNPLKNIKYIVPELKTIIQSQKQPQFSIKTLPQQKNARTVKTIDTISKIITQKTLFSNFRQQSPPNNNTSKDISRVIIRQQNLQMPSNRTSRVNSKQYFKSVSPIKNQNFLSPPSVKFMQQIIPPILDKSNISIVNKLDEPMIKKVESVFQIVTQKNPQKQETSRINTTRFQRQYFSPEVNKASSRFFISSPKTNRGESIVISQQNKVQNVPQVYPQVSLQGYLQSTQTQTQKIQKKQQKSLQLANIQKIQKRKGKKFQFAISKPDIHLISPEIPDYQPKTQPDFQNNHFIQQYKSSENSKNSSKNSKYKSFLSHQFTGMGFQLNDRDFKQTKATVNPSPCNNKPKIPQKVTLQVPKIEIKTRDVNQKKIKNNSINLQIKQIDSQVVLISPRSPRNHREVINYSSIQKFQIMQKAQMNMQKKYQRQRIQNKSIQSELIQNFQSKQSKYVGPVNIKGQKQGYGKIYFSSGGYYMGHFFKDFMHGEGKLYYPSGNLAYEGIFKYNKFHGFGKLYNQNPSYIQAFDFRNFNKIQVTDKQQPIHREHFLINPIKSEKKISYWKCYEGEMSHDMKNGKGIWYLENGQKYEGEFSNDLVQGNGTFYGQNGKIQGKWEENLLVEIYR